MRRLRLSTTLSVTLLAACAKPSQFDRYMATGSWSDAAREYAADPSLQQSERAVYEAGLLFSTPGRVTYDPPKARETLNRFLARFPDSDHRADVTARLLLIEEMLRTRQATTAREKELEKQIASLTRETRDLRVRLDSALVAGDSVRATIKRIEDERRDRDEQIKALRLELQRLKEIDLRPRTPTRPPSPLR